MTVNEKTAQIEKREKEFADFLDKCGLHYRITIPAKDHSTAFEFSTLTNVEKLTDVACCCLEIIRDSGSSREDFVKLLNNMLAYVEEDVKK